MTDARVTQNSVEQWAAPNPAAQSTQIGIEVWGAITVGLTTAIISQIAFEQWANVTATTPAFGQTFVTVNSG